MKNKKQSAFDKATEFPVEDFELDSAVSENNWLKYLKLHTGSDLKRDEYSCNILNEENHFLAKTILSVYLDPDKAEQLAAYICEAVNNYQKLLDSNKELVEVLKLVLENSGYIMSDILEQRIQVAITNAKQR